MARLLFTCAYDGTPWRGWQSQPCGKTVQDCLESVFERILKQSLRISSAGRTDAGVHARAQRFHADIPETCRMTPGAWVAALNAQLPASIRIYSAECVASDFHARFNATGKVYEYLIWHAPVLPPHWVHRAWHHPHALELDLLRRALAAYCGTHDFRHFAARRGNEPAVPPAGFYTRTIYSATCEQQGDALLALRFHGSGFMYRMVRLLVGAACRVATGRMPLAELHSALSAPPEVPTRYCAPAEGLYLDAVFYA